MEESNLELIALRFFSQPKVASSSAPMSSCRMSLKLSRSRAQTSVTLIKLFSQIICRICSFATGIKIFLFDKNLHILILTEKKPFISKNTNLFTLPQRTVCMQTDKENFFIILGNFLRTIQMVVFIKYPVFLLDFFVVVPMIKPPILKAVFVLL